ncbi:MAG: hypothetical protein LBQ50_08680 [Planctomycetaceae bacterium]|jgi:hypothetical protein|nr:hypothetical protein [Planctomycetaceae bacterium]
MIASRLRLFLFSVFVFAQFHGVDAQIPNDNGRIWQTYPIRPEGFYPPHVNLSQLPGTQKISLPQTPTVIDFIKRETGEAAWIGENFGLIGSDGQKIYVYHNPAIQQRVGEIVGRFLQPESQNIQFDVQLINITVSQEHFEKTGIFGSFNRFQPILTPDGKPVSCQTFWIAKEDIPDFEEAFATAHLLTNRSQPPILKTHNGQFGIFMDTMPSEYVTGFVQGQPIKTTYLEGLTLTAFSLLSGNGKTVTTDLSIEFAKINRLDKRFTVTGETVKIPLLAKEHFEEKNLVWASDSMLVMVLGSVRIAETQTDSLIGRFPLLNRTIGWLPLSNRPTGRTTQSIYSIITVRMRDLTKNPLTPIEAAYRYL